MFIKMLPKEIRLRKKQTHNNGFDITDKNDIAELSTALKDIENKYPVVLKFLETFCGYNSPVNSNDPYQICYSGGKRDVILTIKTNGDCRLPQADTELRQPMPEPARS